jgi:hypothetical protein
VESGNPDGREKLSLNDAAAHLLEECRMVLPGIQALFGFQLVAVFNNRFKDALSAGEQQLHLVSTVLVAVAVALVMAPAAWHRQVEPATVSETFLRVSSRMLLWSMLPLGIAISLEVYLVSHVILGSLAMAMTIAMASFCVFVLFWGLLPGIGPIRRIQAEKRGKNE